eukprot:gene5605-7737_t
MNSLFGIIVILCFAYNVCGFSASFRQRSSPRMKLSMHKVRIINNKLKQDYTVEVPPGKIILDTAESLGKYIPYSCRAGSCSTCIGRTVSGTTDQTGQIFLNDKQINDGFVLTCVATATSDCTIEVDIEDVFYNLNPDLVQ